MLLRIIQNTPDGTQLVKKPTAFMTNAEEIGWELNKRCQGGHRHVQLVNGRAKRAEVYPDELCYCILKGLMKQMKRDNRIQQRQIGMVMPEDETAWDDTTGEQLDWEGVRKAREEEMMEVGKHDLWTKRPIDEC